MACMTGLQEGEVAVGEHDVIFLAQRVLEHDEHPLEPARRRIELVL